MGTNIFTNASDVSKVASFLTVFVMIATFSDADAMLSYSGSSNGVAYFVEDTPNEVGLHEAEATCAYEGFRLGTIQDLTQRDFLSRRLDDKSGQDSHVATQFAWKGLPDSPDANVLGTLDTTRVPEPLSCLTFRKGIFGIANCVAERALVLCADDINPKKFT